MYWFQRFMRVSIIFVFLLAWSGLALAETLDVRIVFTSSIPNISKSEGQAGLEELASLLANERADGRPVFFLHGGRALGPSPLGTLDQGAHMVTLLNDLGPSAMSITGRELMYGKDVLIKRASEADFLFLSANIFSKGLRSLGKKIEPSVLLSAGSFKIGVFSIVASDIVSDFLVEDVDIHDPALVVSHMTDKLRDEGADIIILLTDVAPQDLSELQKKNGLDFVFVANPTSSTITVDNDGVIAELGGTERVVVLDVSISSGQSKGAPVLWSAKSRLPRLSDYKASPVIKGKIDAYKSKLTDLLDVKIGTTLTAMETLREAVRTKENAFGNFVSDVLRQFMKADVALINGGSIRANRIYAPDIPLTRGDILNELPFDNYPTLLRATGKQIWEALENGVSRVEEAGGRFPHVSNMTFTYDPDAPRNDRLIELRIGGEAVNLTKDYTIALTDFLARGGDGYNVFKDAIVVTPSVRQRQLWEVVIDKIISVGYIRPATEERIRTGTVDTVLASPITDLTDEEGDWIAEQQVLRVHNETTWAPFNFNELGRPKGFSIDYMKLLAAKIGVKVEFVSGPTWGEFLGLIKAKNLDVMMNIVRTPDRDDYILFTKPYVDNPPVVITTKDSNISDFASLFDKEICIPKGFFYQEILARQFPKIKVITTPDQVDCLKMVSDGKVAGTIGGMVIQTHLMNKHFLSNLHVAAHITETAFSNKMRIGVRNDWPLLRGILDKAIAAVTEDEERPLRDRWISASGQRIDRRINLSKAERVWLARHQELLLGFDSAWPPFEFLSNDDVYSGIASGYVDIIKERLGIGITPMKNLPWSQVIRQVKAGGIDILPAVARTPEREKFLNFTNPYLSFPIVIATRKEGVFVGALDDLDGKTVGVGQGYATVDILSRNYPGIILSEYPNIGAAMDALSDGKIDAVVDNLGVITYETDKLGLDNTKISAPTEYNFEIAMGVRKDWPELVPILNKTLETVTADERKVLRNTWMALEVSFGLDMKTILTWAVPIGTAVMFVIVFIMVWNRKLGSEILKREEAQAKLTMMAQNLDDKNHMLEGLSEKLSKYLSPQIYRSIFKGDQDVSLDTKRKKLTLFFSDIKNFTSTTENLQAEDLAYLINMYLSEMSTIALEHGATIDKFIGDAVVIFFGDPETRGVKEDAQACVEMAIAMQRRMKELKDVWLDKGYEKPFEIRIGINTGYCNVGNFGSDERMDYTVIGGEVNLAARLESEADPGGILLSYETYALVRDVVAAEARPPVHVKGIQRDVQPYAVIGIYDDMDSNRFIRREQNGMSLILDREQFDDDGRKRAISELEEVIEKLKN